MNIFTKFIRNMEHTDALETNERRDVEEARRTDHEKRKIIALAEIEENAVAMTKRSCFFQGENSTCTRECVHFKEGYLIERNYTSLFAITQFEPACNLWQR